ncbi:methyltransferase domain-containing protein [Galbibacter sp. EGI 63066]|uniref:class I SAM-dependent methyltransferase n=1 Tax=Galbibacter sp. EGI 63066 TaxID=2993559 RepID=UPI002248C7A8|nr:methyltransferase domain-containing protein [Galbibacter sp. EGI 63066]MCX2680716.1 methyltransferase domain-containing protein [Galbibacter sp. EGI 63066]
MELKRKPFQGVLNIIHFNWHFFLLSALVLIVLTLLKNQFSETIQDVLIIGVIITTFTITISLLVSFYIYDLSDLYQLKWLKNSGSNKILNINAGFDETSEIIKNKFNNADLTICDFYNPSKHTEVSIKRARRTYPPHPKTISVQTDQLPFPENTFDKTLAILSAHEIRDKQERAQFFKELNRITKSSGQIFVTEHLRDLNNFLAYTIGFLHFHSKSS